MGDLKKKAGVERKVELSRITRRALYTHARGTKKDGKDLLVMYFRDREDAYGPFMFPIDEFLFDKKGGELKPAEYASLVLRRADIFLQMEEELVALAQEQKKLHLQMREYVEAQARGENTKGATTAIRKKAEQLEERVKALSPENELDFNLGERRARIILGERAGYSWGQRTKERPNEDLDILLDMMSVDIEQVYWWDERSETDLIAISRKRTPDEKTENILIGYYPEYDYGLKLAKYVHVPNVLELRLDIARRMLESPMIVTQNGQSYDWRQLMKRHFVKKKEKKIVMNDGKFRANIDNSQFFLEDRGHGDWGVRLRAIDRFELDLVKVAEYYNDYLPDKKLETLDEFFTVMERVDVRLGSAERQVRLPTFHKSLNYEELDRCRTNYDLLDDPSVIAPRLQYAEEDTEVPLKIAQKMIPRLRVIAYLTGNPLQDGMNSRPAKLAKRWWDRIYFDHFGRPRLQQRDKDRDKLEYFDQTRFESPPRPKEKKQKAQTDLFAMIDDEGFRIVKKEEEIRKPDKDDEKRLKQGKAKLSYKEKKEQMILESLRRIRREKDGKTRGLFQKVNMYHASPIMEASSPALIRHPQIAQAKQRLDKSNNAAQRIMYMELMDSFAREAVYDLVRVEWNLWHKKHFAHKYGRSYESLENLVNRGVDERMRAMTSLGLVTHARNNYFLQHAMSKEMMERVGARRLGTVDVLSLGRGRAIYKFQGMILRTGIKIPSKKARTLDERIRVTKPRVETRIVRDFVEKCFEDVGGAVKYLAGAAKSLRNGDGEIHDYIWRVRVREDLKNLSLVSRRRQSAKIIKALGGEKGEELFVLVVKDEKGKTKYLGYRYGANMFYEYDRKKKERVDVEYNGKSFGCADGKTYRLATGWYQDRITGFYLTGKKPKPGEEDKRTKNESTVYEIMRSLMPRNRELRELRDMLVYGEANMHEVDMLADKVREISDQQNRK